MSVWPGRGEPQPLRRRRFTAPHRRRSLALRLLRPFLLAVVVVALSVTATAWVLQAPQFRLQSVELAGTERVPGVWVRERVAPLYGRHLLRLSLADLEAELAGHPWIAGVAMRKRLPDTLSVSVVERRPAALLRTAGGLDYVDAEGRRIAPFVAGAGPADLLLVRAPADAERPIAAAIAAAAELSRLEPLWGAELSEVEVVGDGDLRFYTAALPFALLLGAGGMEGGLRRLRRALPEVRRRFGDAASLDLRFSGRIVVVPTATPLSEEG